MQRKVLRYIIPSEFDGKTLKEYLKQNCGLSSRSIILLKRENMGISRNGILIRTVDTVREGDEIVLSLPEDENLIVPVEGDIDVIYEDDSIIALNKPPLMPVHPTKIHQNDTLANLLSSYMNKRGEYYTFRAINRLDRDTSGIVLVAKDRISSFQLQKNIEKTYYAVCEGVIENSGTIDMPIKVEDGRSIQRITAPDGARAVTHYEPLAVRDSFTLLRIKLETGRTHQIRCHLSSIGHPLCGDDMYGGHLDHIRRQALHCGNMSFCHPMTERVVTIDCGLPDDIRAIIDFDIRKGL